MRFLVSLVALGLGTWAGLFPPPAIALPDFASLRSAHKPSDIELLDRHGEPIQTLRIDNTVRRAAWLPLTEMSPALRNAMVQSEDKQFWQHSGVDWHALAASAWANAWNTKTRGASTVTMQLAGLLEADLKRPGAGRSVMQKVGQIGLAQQLEARWSKAQILEAYLNLVPLRGEVVGVSTAAQVMFGKHASGLDQLESALLAALVRGPNATEAVVTRRACEVMQAQRLTCDGLATLTAQTLARKPVPLGGEGAPNNIAPHFARWWRGAAASHNNPRTTLDARLQRLAAAALRQQLAELRGREVEDGAVLVLDNRTGEVRAWVGSAGAGSNAPEVDAVLARRQPGSTLKPFVYAEALTRGLITEHSLLHDSPLQLARGQDVYQPQNFDHGWRGWVSMREALAASLNVPAVRVGAMLGPEALFEVMNRAGLRLRENAGFHGHALALGSAEVTLLDLTNAYRAVANHGQWAPVSKGLTSNVGQQTSQRATSQRLMSAEVAHILTGILADSSARASTFGFDSPLVTRRTTAAKTGTSKDMRDNWCLGYSDAYTVGVWLGNASGRPMHGVSGVMGAAPVWRSVMEGLPGAGVVTTTVAMASNPAMSAKGNLPAASAAHLARASTAAWGIHPVRDGSVLAIDPDIPLRAQRLHLRGPHGQWWMDGSAVGTGTAVWWPLTPGRHVLELRGAQRQLIDKVTFEVRNSVRNSVPNTVRPAKRKTSTTALSSGRSATEQPF